MIGYEEPLTSKVMWDLLASRIEERDEAALSDVSSETGHLERRFPTESETLMRWLGASENQSESIEED